MKNVRISLGLICCGPDDLSLPSLGALVKPCPPIAARADVAQLVEQLIRNAGSDSGASGK